MLRFVLAFVVGLALTISAYADEQQYADAIFMEAVDLHMASKNAADTRQRLKYLRLAHATLKQLIEQYPSSPIAKRAQVRLSATDVSLEMLRDEIEQAGWALCPQSLNRVCILEFALTTADFANARTARDGVIMAMVEMHADAGDFDAAMEMAKEIKHVIFWPSAHERIAKAQAAAGDPESGLATAMEILDPNERVRALAGVIAASRSADHATQYREAVMAALAASEHVGYVTDLPQALAQIAEAQAVAGDFNGALETAARIREVDEDSRQKLGFALAGIARLQAEAGHAAQAKVTVERALSVAERTMEVHPRAGILLQVMDAQIAAKDIEGARATAQRLGERYRVATSIMLHRGYANARENESAKAMLELALQDTGSVDAGHDRATILGRVGLALAKAGDADGARMMFQDALGAAAGIVDPREHAVALSRLSDAVREGRDSESTRKVAESLRALIEGDGGTRKNPILLASVAGNLAQLGDVTTAMAVTAMIGDMEQRVRALVEIAATLPH